MAASRINATNCLIGAKTKITITRDSALYRHTLKMRYGTGPDIVIVEKTTKIIYYAPIPDDIYSLIPNSRTATVKIICETYSGSTMLGESNINITVTADETKCKPIISYSSLLDTNTKTVAFSGSNLKCVANESKMTVSGVSARFPITGDTATIVSRKLRCGAKEATVNNSGTASIENAPSGYMRLIFVDSRGFESTLQLNAETIYYEKPVIYGKFYRPVPTEGTIKVDYSGNLYYQAGIQTNLLHVWYGTPNRQIIGAWNWVEIALPTVTVPSSPQTTGYEKSNITLGSSFPYTDGFRFKLKVKDGLYDVESEEYYVNRGTPIFDWGDTDFNFNVDINFDNKDQSEERRVWFSGTGTHSHSATLYGGNPNSNTAIGLYDNGNGHGILQYRDTDNRIIFGNGDTSLYLGSQLMDFVIENGSDTGSDGTWYYQKWASGKLEAWGRFAFANPNWTAWGAQYTAEYDLIYLGLNLVSTPYVFVTTSGGVYGSVVGVKGATSALCTVALARPNTTTSTMYLNCHLIGRWK